MRYTYKKFDILAWMESIQIVSNSSVFLFDISSNSSIVFKSRVWLRNQNSCLLGLFETIHTYHRLFYKISWALHDEMRQVFYLFFYLLIMNHIYVFAWILFFIFLWHCICYTNEWSSDQDVSICLQKYSSRKDDTSLMR